MKNKRFLSILLSIAMVLSLSLSISTTKALAVGPDTVSVGTWNELLTAVASAKTDGTQTIINVTADLPANSKCTLLKYTNILIQSVGGPFTIKRDTGFTSGEIFFLNADTDADGAKLALTNIILDGNSGNSVISHTAMVFVGAGSVFTMDTGATIQNAKSDYDTTGVYINVSGLGTGAMNFNSGATITNIANDITNDRGTIGVAGILNINGGTITNNIANHGAIWLSRGAVNISGSPTISGNTKVDGTPCNVYQELTTLAVTGVFTPTTKIGITYGIAPTAGTPQNVTSATNSTDLSSYFVSDNDNYAISNSGSGATQQVQLKVVTKVMTWVGLCSAVGNAPTDGTEKIINVTNDLTANSTCDVLSGENIIIISSNGSKITRHSSLTTTSIFDVSGKLTLRNITIQGDGTTTYISPVIWNNKGTLIMGTGATISNFAVNYDGAAVVQSLDGSTVIHCGATITNVKNTSTENRASIVDIDYNKTFNSTFNMDGGTIKNNQAQNGGVLLADATVNLTGSPNISGNTKLDGMTPCNLYLCDKAITITAPFTPATPIGITSETVPTPGSPVDITSASSTDLSGCFVSDNPSYVIKNSGSGSSQVVQLAVPTYALTVNLDGGSGATVGAYYASGASVSINAGTKSGYTFSEWTSSAGGTFGDASSATTSFIMPPNATTVTAVWTPVVSCYIPPVNNNTTVIVDNKDYSIGTENKNGPSTTATVDQPKLMDEISKASDSSSVVFPVSANTNVTAQLVVKNVEDMAKKDMILTVETGKVAYNLNTSAIDTSKITAALDNADSKNIPFNVSISNSKATVSGTSVVVAPVEFTITATYNGKTVNIDTFSCFVDRTIEITAEQAGKITTAVVVQPDGSLRHVPTKVTVVNGKYYAVINSLTNSTYTVIYNPVSFADVSSHWAKDAVNDMGSRMVVSGVGNGRYEPDRDITRAEFSAIVVRALGLAPSAGASSFSDVDASEWYCGYVTTASAYGLVKGYSATSFGPKDTITREQAMTMISRAMAITGLKPQLADSDINTLIAKYSDAAAASDYAKSSISACLKTGIITGRDSTTLAPKDFITRAEVAVTVQRLLKKSGLI